MSTLAEIRELISNLANLTLDQLAELRTMITSYFDEVDALETTPDNVAILNELVEHSTAVMGAQSAIETAQAEAEAQKVKAREAIAALRGEKPEDEDEDPEGGEAAEDETTMPETVAEAEDEVAEEVEPALAATGAKPGTSISRMARTSAKPKGSPNGSNSGRGRTALVATGQLDGAQSGEIISDRERFAELMAGTLSHMDRQGSARGKVTLARAEWADKYHEGRRLGPDADVNTRVMRMAEQPEAMVATGGICSPLNVDWSMEAWATAERPLRDGLSAFQATRGGILYRLPPDYSALSSSTAVWTEATDASPAGATKPVQAIACPSTTTAYVDAIPTRLGFGNMEGMFDPETVAINTELALAYAAQVADLNLWNRIQAQATTGITTGQILGASRTFLVTLSRCIMIYKQQHRLSDNQQFTIIAPRWLRDLIIEDRMLELAHDDAGTSVFMLDYSWVDDVLAKMNVKAIWMLDPPPVKTGTGAYATQQPGAFAANTATPVYPAVVVWDLFVEGGVQLLDGGRLDFGVIRDSTLDATNDYETFVEPFEGIAARTFTGGVLQFITTICGVGSSAASATYGSCL